ncbi:MAG: lamin tail domain-containing protein, partial [bacterium]|nr:lamin tail domain-containing protein [bacterium]
ELSEIMPNPDGSDKNKEWIELQNTSNETVNLENWQITNNKTHTIKGKKIQANSQITIDDLKITLRNKEDHIQLINPEGKIIEEVSYKKAPSGQSFSKISKDWNWASPSKNKNNGKLQASILTIEEFLNQYKVNQNQETLLTAISKKPLNLNVSTLEKENKSILLDFEIQNPKQLKNRRIRENWLIYCLVLTIPLATTAYLLPP